MIFWINNKRKKQRGFTLLIAVLLSTVVLAIGLSILNITLKEFILSTIARESAVSLNAADAGLECAFYWDRSTQGNRFDIPVSSPFGMTPGAPATTIDNACMGQSITVGGRQNGQAQEFEIQWNPPDVTDTVCARVSVTKYTNMCMAYDASGNCARFCPAGIECTRVVSYGYNNACTELDKRNTVERALRALY
jgi:type II secretory pathway pseudopilin PulG